MSAFHHFKFSLLCATVLTGTAGAQNAPASAPAAAPRDKDHVVQLDKFVVSSGPDRKASFDLAQGTSVLVGEDLRRLAQATLGETLADTPGVTSSYYGPGASRPVIRGLGGDRVRVLTNGTGALDASSVSPDHNTALEPLFASRIEVLRGPSTLLYGGSAVGGVVNVIDRRIPEITAEGAPPRTIELRAGGPAGERAAVLAAGFASKEFALQINALRRGTDDLRIPGVARSDADAPTRQLQGRLPGSESRTFSGSLGGAWAWRGGQLGVALGQYESVYGVPTGDSPPTSINLKQTRLDLAAETTQPFGSFRGAKASLGIARYNHAELGGADVNTLFKNKALEGRLELPHVAIGELTGTVGLQTARSDFSAVGAEVATPPSLTQSAALFALEELRLSPVATLQFGARLECQSIRIGEASPALPSVAGYSARPGKNKKSGGISTSLGGVFYPAKDWSLGLAVASTERLPTTQELFSNGPHGGTGAYEVGTTGLGNEKSLGIDVSLRRRSGFVTGSIGAYVNRFRDYIFEQQLPAAAIPAANNPDALTPYQFVAKNAVFYGAEAEFTLHLLDRDQRRVHLTLTSDTVHAGQTADDVPLPRIPSLRFGAALIYDDGRWSAGIGARHVTRQNRFTASESATPGYTLVNAHLSYLIPAGRFGCELFARGNNLGNATAREHTSFLKELAPLPGRGVLGGVRVTF